MPSLVYYEHMTRTDLYREISYEGVENHRVGLAIKVANAFTTLFGDTELTPEVNKIIDDIAQIGDPDSRSGQNTINANLERLRKALGLDYKNAIMDRFKQLTFDILREQ